MEVLISQIPVNTSTRFSAIRKRSLLMDVFTSVIPELTVMIVLSSQLLVTPLSI